MFSHLHSIQRLPQALIGQGVRLYSINLLHPHAADTHHYYVTAIVLAEAPQPEAPGAALVVKARFRQPMAPMLNPDHPLWHEHVAPHLDEALLAMRHPSPAVSLGGVLVQVTTLVNMQPEVIGGGGCVVLPKRLPPISGTAYGYPAIAPKPPNLGNDGAVGWRWAA